MLSRSLNVRGLAGFPSWGGLQPGGRAASSTDWAPRGFLSACAGVIGMSGSSATLAGVGAARAAAGEWVLVRRTVWTTVRGRCAAWLWGQPKREHSGGRGEGETDLVGSAQPCRSTGFRRTPMFAAVGVRPADRSQQSPHTESVSMASTILVVASAAQRSQGTAAPERDASWWDSFPSWRVSGTRCMPWTL